MKLYKLPEWREKISFEEEDSEAWKWQADIEAAKALYNKWREVFEYAMIFCDTLPENDKMDAERMILENAMIVSPKIQSAAGDVPFIFKMENATVIRTNCIQLMHALRSASFIKIAAEDHVQVMRDEMDEFKRLFKAWASGFKKTADDLEDEWGLF